MNDPFHMHRFISALAPVYHQVRAKLFVGGKTGPWMQPAFLRHVALLQAIRGQSGTTWNPHGHWVFGFPRRQQRSKTPPDGCLPEQSDTDPVRAMHRVGDRDVFRRTVDRQR